MNVIRKFLALLVGIPIVIIGIILIPLPGPGFLIVFAGLFILSIEFEWARKHRDIVQEQLKKILDKSRSKTDGTPKK